MGRRLFKCSRTAGVPRSSVLRLMVRNMLPSKRRLRSGTSESSGGSADMLLLRRSSAVRRWRRETSTGTTCIALLPTPRIDKCCKDVRKEGIWWMQQPSRCRVRKPLHSWRPLKSLPTAGQPALQNQKTCDGTADCSNTLYYQRGGQGDLQGSPRIACIELPISDWRYSVQGYHAKVAVGHSANTRRCGETCCLVCLHTLERCKWGLLDWESLFLQPS
jgi:hypothetical protein